MSKTICHDCYTRVPHNL
ncbi:hypothetical protein HQ545_01285 [Candidatus Woesearchaeota archaeon]|nr:hypothetical protein [Candidatus Woesearchaeota archaeon]